MLSRGTSFLTAVFVLNSFATRICKLCANTCEEACCLQEKGETSIICPDKSRMLVFCGEKGYISEGE